ncbi:UDP-glucuronosyl/UDP-glucosyltransferase [Corchorus olitorius]|uniref:UDP-glucuronosyl/UDP-glucosyltransferase n=1 Tax=Corchorus olitorius TaxID=93759 RepID=A0A1R3J1L1_9ROSI|nr:UDP-glucuronosyl/UDP-glucosyltransferase [Corchorus olitorius]
MGCQPHLMNTLKKAFDMSSPHFSKILKTLNPDLLIYDSILPWAPLLALSNKIPAVHFLCTSATVSSFSVHALKKPCEEEFPFPNIYYCFMNAKFNNKMENCSGDDGFSDIDRTLQSFERSMKIISVKTFEELEGKFMDYLSVLLNKKIVPTGPLIQDPNEEEGDDDERTKMFLEWLNKKGKSSTVFVSFGSEYFLSKEEREEIAYGLVLSKFGVPIIAIPMHLDQPLNARHVVDVGVGLRDVLPVFLSAFTEKAGLLGAAAATESVLSIVNTSNMDGLSSGFSWTQSNAICMHLMVLQAEDESSSDESMNSVPLSSIHRSYACITQIQHKNGFIAKMVVL